MACRAWLRALLPWGVQSLRDNMVERTFEDGEQVVRQGDTDASFFFIVEGSYELRKVVMNCRG